MKVQELFEQQLDEGIFTTLRKMIYQTRDERAQAWLLQHTETIQELIQMAAETVPYFKAKYRNLLNARLNNIRRDLERINKDAFVAGRLYDNVRELESFLRSVTKDKNARLQKPKFQQQMPAGDME